MEMDLGKESGKVSGKVSESMKEAEKGMKAHRKEQVPECSLPEWFPPAEPDRLDAGKAAYGLPEVKPPEKPPEEMAEISVSRNAFPL